MLCNFQVLLIKWFSICNYETNKKFFFYYLYFEYFHVYSGEQTLKVALEREATLKLVEIRVVIQLIFTFSELSTHIMMLCV